MNDSDAVKVIQRLDEALNIIRRHDGQLSAQAVRTKTMLAIARAEVAQLLSDSDAQQAGEVFARPPSASPFSPGTVPAEGPGHRPTLPTLA